MRRSRPERIDRAANRAAHESHDHRRAGARARRTFAIDKFIVTPRRTRSLRRRKACRITVIGGTQVSGLTQSRSPCWRFANLSDDKGSEYFSDGISEELLTVLQKIPGLHVAARTSAFSFKGKNATAQEIGQKLGVARLVEGSVRKAGDIVRIAARLTQADTGEQLWSENYTRDLKDVFAVQTELAQTIVGQLSGQLTAGAADPAAKSAIQAQVQAAEKGGTKNVEAHQHYLQGRFYTNRHSEKGAGEALAEYQRAVELDPAFALAWAGLAQTHVWYCDFSTRDRTGGLRRPSGSRARGSGAGAGDSSPTCRKRCAPARTFSSISISTGREQARRCGCALGPGSRRSGALHRRGQPVP